MNCPICNDVRLREVEKSGVHIDTCPDCKGVWLDRGELDKLMSGIREVRQEYNSWYKDDNERDKERKDSYPRSNERHDSDYKNKPYKKKNSVLDVFSDLF